MGEEESSIFGIEQIGSRKERRETAKDAKKKKELKPFTNGNVFQTRFYLDLRGALRSLRGNCF